MANKIFTGPDGKQYSKADFIAAQAKDANFSTIENITHNDLNLTLRWHPGIGANEGKITFESILFSTRTGEMSVIVFQEQSKALQHFKELSRQAGEGKRSFIDLSAEFIVHYR